MDKDNSIAEQQSRYLEQVKKRIEAVKEMQTIDFQYEVRMGGLTVQFNLPKRVMEQKRLLGIWAKWDADPSNTELETDFYVAVAPLTYVNGQKLDLNTTELEFGTVDAIMTAYGDFMMRPFASRATTKTNSHLSEL